jgi:hypothetical protein
MYTLHFRHAGANNYNRLSCYTNKGDAITSYQDLLHYGKDDTEARGGTIQLRYNRQVLEEATL